jgi:hypothetical protein
MNFLDPTKDWSTWNIYKEQKKSREWTIWNIAMFKWIIQMYSVIFDGMDKWWIERRAFDVWFKICF